MRSGDAMSRRLSTQGSSQSHDGSISQYDAGDVRSTAFTEGCEFQVVEAARVGLQNAYDQNAHAGRYFVSE